MMPHFYEHRSFCDRLAKPQDFLMLPLPALHVIMASRLCVICAKGDQDPTPALEQRFGSVLAAKRFRVLVMAIDQAWPEPFLISRPCCQKMTPDEAMVAELTVALGQANCAAYDLVARDMLSAETREQLHIRFSAFLRALSAGE